MAEGDVPTTAGTADTRTTTSTDIGAEPLSASKASQSHRTRANLSVRVFWGSLFLMTGLIAPSTYLETRARTLGGGKLTITTLRHALHGALHSPTGIIVLLAGNVAFAVGATLLGRLVIRRRRSLVVLAVTAVVTGPVLGFVTLLGLVLTSDAQAGISRVSPSQKTKAV